MIRRRRLLASLFALMISALLFAIPAVHGPLIGWARGEPFFQGWPASHWSDAIRSSEADFFALLSATGYGNQPMPATRMKLDRKRTSLDHFFGWLAQNLGNPELYPQRSALFDAPDVAALPVLIALVDDPNPRVRYFAAQCIGDLREAGRPALPKLKQLAMDDATITVRRFSDEYEITVGEAVARPIFLLETARYWNR